MRNLVPYLGLKKIAQEAERARRGKCTLFAERTGKKVFIASGTWAVEAAATAWDLLFRSAFLHDAPADGERLDANGARTGANSIHRVFDEAETFPLASRAGVHIELSRVPCADVIQYPGGIVTLDMELYKYADAKQARAIYARSRTGPVLLDFGDVRAIVMPVRHGGLDDIRQRVLDFIANDGKGGAEE